MRSWVVLLMLHGINSVGVGRREAAYWTVWGKVKNSTRKKCFKTKVHFWIFSVSNLGLDSVRKAASEFAEISHLKLGHNLSPSRM